MINIRITNNAFTLLSNNINKKIFNELEDWEESIPAESNEFEFKKTYNLQEFDISQYDTIIFSCKTNAGFMTAGKEGEHNLKLNYHLTNLIRSSVRLEQGLSYAADWYVDISSNGTDSTLELVLKVRQGSSSIRGWNSSVTNIVLECYKGDVSTAIFLYENGSVGMLDVSVSRTLFVTNYVKADILQ